MRNYIKIVLVLYYLFGDGQKVMSRKTAEEINDILLLAPTPFPSKFPTMSYDTPFPTIPAETDAPTRSPTPKPTTKSPTKSPTPRPTTKEPTPNPTTKAPTTKSPTVHPTSKSPTRSPVSNSPTKNPTTLPPTAKPTTQSPTTTSPTKRPTDYPTHGPVNFPTTFFPTKNPTKSPTNLPTHSPILVTHSPFASPTSSPITSFPSNSPTIRESLPDIPTNAPNGSLDPEPKNILGDTKTMTYVVAGSIGGLVLIILLFLVSVVRKRNRSRKSKDIARRSKDGTFRDGKYVPVVARYAKHEDDNVVGIPGFSDNDGTPMPPNLPKTITQMSKGSHITSSPPPGMGPYSSNPRNSINTLATRPQTPPRTKRSDHPIVNKPSVEF